MERFNAVLNLLSVVVIIFAATMLVPLALSLHLGDGAEQAYDKAILATALAGGLSWVATRGRQRELQARDGFLLVTLAWTVLPAFGALPLLSYLPKLSFTEAYFEAMSGLTTTGRGRLQSGLRHRRRWRLTAEQSRQ